MSPVSSKIVSAQQLPQYLHAGLHFSAFPGHHSSSHNSHYLDLISHGFDHLPLFLCADLSILLDHGEDAPFSSKTLEHQEDQLQRFRYESDVLIPLLRNRSFLETLNFIEEQSDKAPYQTSLLRSLCRIIAPHWPRDYRLNPAILREFSGTKQAVEFQAPFTRSWIHRSLEQFLSKASHSLSWKRSFDDSLRFVVEHCTVLGREDSRSSCRRIPYWVENLGLFPIGDIDLGHESEESDSRFIDHSHYPTGGLSELTNRGSVENLVKSELVYMESGEDINLFDVRLLEGELLYYMRDSGQLRRKRRSIHFVFDCRRVFFVKSRDAVESLSILVQALALRMIRDLTALFEDDALQFHLHYLGPVEDKAYQRERQHLELLLKPERDRELVHFHSRPEATAREFHDPKRKTYLVVFCHENADFWQSEFEVPSFQIHGVSVNAGIAARGLAGVSSVDLDRSSLQALRLTRNEIIQRLLR